MAEENVHFSGKRSVETFLVTSFSENQNFRMHPLPADVTSAPSLFTFRKRLKLHLFSLSYPGLVH